MPSAPAFVTTNTPWMRIQALYCQPLRPAAAAPCSARFPNCTTATNCLLWWPFSFTHHRLWGAERLWHIFTCQSSDAVIQQLVGKSAAKLCESSAVNVMYPGGSTMKDIALDILPVKGTNTTVTNSATKQFIETSPKMDGNEYQQATAGRGVFLPLKRPFGLSGTAWC